MGRSLALRNVETIRDDPMTGKKKEKGVQSHGISVFLPKSFKKPRPRDFILKLDKREGCALKQRDQRYQVIIGIES